MIKTIYLLNSGYLQSSHGLTIFASHKNLFKKSCHICLPWAQVNGPGLLSFFQVLFILFYIISSFQILKIWLFMSELFFSSEMTRSTSSVWLLELLRHILTFWFFPLLAVIGREYCGWFSNTYSYTLLMQSKLENWGQIKLWEWLF